VATLIRRAASRFLLARDWWVRFLTGIKRNQIPVENCLYHFSYPCRSCFGVDQAAARIKSSFPLPAVTFAASR
jgi:hypothetical protein